MRGQRIIAATALWAALVGGPASAGERSEQPARVLLAAAAQGYPEHPIDLIVPSTPGSSADILGRVLTEEMAGLLGQRFVVYNKAGAGGVLGTAEVARAKPDGYTLMHGAAFSVTVQPFTERNAGYTAQSFAPICQTFKNDQVIVARPGTYKTLAELVAASKAKPGGLNFGSPGLGTIPHLAMAEFSQVTKVPFNHVPFKGPAESIQMTIGGQIDFAVAPLTAASGSGLTMPALFAEKRNPAIPDVPTVKEQGYDVSPLSIGGLFGPAGLPADIKVKLENSCKTAVQSEPFQKMVKQTLQPADWFQDSAGFAANVAKDVEAKRKLLTALGMVK
jgi:tripartite-type tricarboxylate transporter receptor subunit TctC